jgi:uracil-DNA glycosylase
MAHKPLMIVGEAWGEQEELKGLPFAGPSGSVLYGLLRQAGIDKEEVYLTNAFNLRPRNNRIESLFTDRANGIEGYRPIVAGKYIDKKYQPELDRLQEEIERVKPNLILASGNTALWALCKKSGIKRYRGSPLMSHDARHKVLPTWHPSAILRQWELRAVALADMTKAKREMTFPELNRPARYIYLDPNIAEIWEFYHEFLKDQPFISCDIETKGKQITEVGYGTADGKRAIVIPFWSRKHKDGNYWPDLETELEAWSIIRHIHDNHRLLGQNFSYDMQYFWRTVGIACPHFEGDTMLLHHSLQPEMEKGLGFLGSIYTNEPSWKFMRQDHNEHFKKGED